MDGEGIPIPSLYFDPDKVVMMASAAADVGSVKGLVAMTSPSSIAAWFDTVPTTVPSSMTSHLSKVGRDDYSTETKKFRWECV